MDQHELLDSLNQNFGSEPYPGDDNIVYNNADWECIAIREAFRHYTWQTTPQQLLLDQQWCLPFLSEAGFRYYLPAFMQFAATDFYGADMIPDNIILRLKLPIEADIIVSAINIRGFGVGKDIPSIDWNEILQNRLKSIENRVHLFIARASLFNADQGRAIYQFLAYMRDERSEEFLSNEPDVAIQRYWFQFAE